MSKFHATLLSGMVVIGLLGCAKQETPVQTPVERGKYLAALGGCSDCHTPKVPGPGGAPVPDSARLMSGHPQDLPYPKWTPEDGQKNNVAATTNSMFTAWAGPWGVSFAINLTPDRETGIGEWKEETFIQAIRTGKHQGQPSGRDILPPMPWFDMKDLTDADMKAIWAYLWSLPPIKNQAPLPIPPAPASTSGSAG